MTSLVIKVNGNKYNMNTEQFKNNNYKKNISDAYIEYMWMDIVNNMIQAGSRDGQQYTTSASVVNKDDMWGLHAQFVYRLFPSRKEIAFYNLSVDSPIRGHGILGKILDKVEQVPGWSVSVRDLGNKDLAYYLGKKRGYSVFTGKNTLVNLPTLASFLKNYPKNFTKQLERLKAMGAAGASPEYAILPSRA